MLVVGSRKGGVFGLLLVVVGASSGCSKATEPELQPPPIQLSGVYVDEPEVLRFYFNDGRVRMTGGIADFETAYEVEDDKLWITTAHGEKKAMMIRSDGALIGELGVFTKQP